MLLLVLVCVIALSGKRLNEGTKDSNTIGEKNDASKDTLSVIQPTTSPEKEETNTIIHKEGKDIVSRFMPPSGFERIEASEDSFGSYIRKFPLLSSDAKVMLYDGSEKWIQDYHAAVFDMSIGKRDLQQCADSIIRVYAEYFFKTKQYEKISFHLTNGFEMKYTKWRDGYRINVNGNKVSWVKQAKKDTSYECFRKYLTTVFTYAGTISLSKEATSVDVRDLQIGDMFIFGGSPGHCVLVVDIVENASKQKAFLLAQGYMPAQSFHIIKNPKHLEDPWYYETEVSYPFQTIQWTFQQGSLKRFNGF